MNVTTEQWNAINVRIKECVSKCFDSEVAAPIITFSFHTDLKRVAGYAYPSEKRIELNIQLLLDNFDSFLEFTIPHEVAHILTDMFYPNAKQGHGPEFRNMCSHIGYASAGRTRHSYDTSVSYDKVRTGYLYDCVCDKQPYIFSKIMHNKMQKGDSRICLTCRTRIIFSGDEVMVRG